MAAQDSLDSSCWICGEPAAYTHEHRVKASDLRASAGPVTRAATLYFHSATVANRIVQGVKSDQLKFDHRICGNCNSRRTQPFDRAWEAAMRFLLEHRPAGGRVRFNRVFPYDSRSRMLDLHLFFVKHFGCQIVEGNVPIDVASFSNALLRRRAHPDIFITLGTDSARLPTLVAHGSDLHTEEVGGRARFATYFYEVGPIVVQLLYAEPASRNREGLRRAWHPSHPSTSVPFLDFARYPVD